MATTSVGSGTNSEFVVSSGNILDVFSAGSALSATVLNGGIEYVYARGNTDATTVSSGGSAVVDEGAHTTNTVLSSGGAEYVLLYGGLVGITSGTVVLDGATQYVGGYLSSFSASYAGGITSDTLISGGGDQNVDSGGTAIDTTVLGSSFTVSGVTSSAPGYQVVNSSGFASNTLLSSGGDQVVYAGGSAIGTTVLAGGIEEPDGGDVTSTFVSAGGFEAIVGGGVAVDATIDGVQDVGYPGFAGGTASFTVVSYGGTENLFSGGIASATVIDGGGQQNVGSGGTAIGATAIGANFIVSAYETLSASGNQVVYSGGVASDTVLSSGGTEEVFSGGVVTGLDMVASGGGVVDQGTINLVSGDVLVSALVQSAGVLNVASGATVTGTTVLAASFERTHGIDSFTVISGGGEQDVDSGGTAIDATVIGSSFTVAGVVSSAFGFQVVYSSGVASGTVLSSGGIQVVYSGGVASDTVISANGQLAVAGGAAIGTTVLPGGADDVYSGHVTSSFVSSGGYEFIFSGGVAVDATVEGIQDVGYPTFGSGTASFTQVSSGGIQNVISGIASATVIDGGGVQNVSAGGTAISATDAGSTFIVSSFELVSALGDQTVFASGVASDTALGSGGIQYVYSGGTASFTQVSSGGTEYIFSSGLADATRLLAGGSAFVESSGTASGAIVQSGGVLTVFDGGLLSGTTDLGSSGALVFNVTGTLTESAEILGPGSVTLLGGGTVTLDAIENYTGKTILSAGTLVLGNNHAAGTGAISFGSGGTGMLVIDGLVMPTNTISGLAAADTIELGGLVYADYSAIRATALGNRVTVSATSGGHTTNYVLTIAGASTDGAFQVGAALDGGTLLTAPDAPCYCPGTLILTDRGERPVEALAIDDRVVTLHGAAEPIRWIGRRSYAAAFVSKHRHLRPVCIKAGALGDGLPRRDLWVSPLHGIYLQGLLVPARELLNGISVVWAETVSEAVHYIHIELDRHGVIYAEGAPAETFLDDDSRFQFHNAHEYAALYPDAAAPGGFCAPRVDTGYELEAVRRHIGTRVQDVPLDRPGTHRVNIQESACGVRLVTHAGYAPSDLRRLGAAVSRIAMDGSELPLHDGRLATGWHRCEPGWRWTDGAALLLTPGARQLEVDVVSLPFAAVA